MRRELWVLEDSRGHHCNPIFEAARAKRTARDLGMKAIRYVPSPPGWTPLDVLSSAPGHCPDSNIPVQFNTYNGTTVGYRQDDGTWYDLLDQGADGSPNHEYRDEHVTHWAPLMSKPQ